MSDKITGLDALKRMGADYANKVQRNPDLEATCKVVPEAFEPDYKMPHRPGLLSMAMAPKTERIDCEVGSISMGDAYIADKIPNMKVESRAFAGESGEFCRAETSTTADGKLVLEERSCFPKRPFNSVKPQ